MAAGAVVAGAATVSGAFAETPARATSHGVTLRAPSLAGHLSLATQLDRSARRERLLDQHLRLLRRLARARDERVARSSQRRARRLSNAALRRANARLRRELRRELRTGGAPDIAIPAALASIAACESGGNPRAIGGGGAYRGKYQFDRGTWAAVGGQGDPAAAPEAEQDRRAAMLYARAGSSPWPVCG
jgi:hypothetical protein